MNGNFGFDFPETEKEIMQDKFQAHVMEYMQYLGESPRDYLDFISNPERMDMLTQMEEAFAEIDAQQEAYEKEQNASNLE